MVHPNDCLLMTKMSTSDNTTAQRKSREVGQNTDQAGLDQDQLADLRGGRAHDAQQAEFAAAVDDDRDQCTGDAQHGDNHGHSFERVGDGERPVEDANAFAANIAIGKDEHVVVGRGSLDLVANGFEIRAGVRYTARFDGAGSGRYLSIVERSRRMIAALVAVVVEDVDRCER